MTCKTFHCHSSVPEIPSYCLSCLQKWEQRIFILLETPCFWLLLLKEMDLAWFLYWWLEYWVKTLLLLQALCGTWEFFAVTKDTFETWFVTTIISIRHQDLLFWLKHTSPFSVFIFRIILIKDEGYEFHGNACSLRTQGKLPSAPDTVEIMKNVWKR